MKLFRSKTFKDAVVNPHSAEFEVNKWTISEFVVEKLVSVSGVHPFPLDELMLMTSAVCKFKPALIFEWGTNIGKSARIFYEICAAFNIDSEIHSVDLPDDVFHNEHPRNDRGKMVKGLSSVSLHQGDGVSVSIEIAGRKNSTGNILFFVDGDHSYESVKRELEQILSAFPNAIVLLHDTFYQSPESKYNVGPYNAINDALKGKETAYMRIATQGGLPGMTLLYKRK